MKQLLKTTIAIAVFTFSGHLLFAPPPPPGSGNNTPYAPIPGIEILLAAGAAYGIKKKLDQKNAEA